MNIYKTTEIPEAVAKNFARYVELDDGEQLLFLYDETIFGSGKGGMAITDRRVIEFKKSSTRSAPYDALSRVVVARANGVNVPHVLRFTDREGKELARAMLISHSQLDEFLDELAALVGPDLIEDPQRSEPRGHAQQHLHRHERLILTTTPTIEGQRIVEYLGVVAGEAVMGANLLRDMAAGVSDVLGGRVGCYESELTVARDLAFAELQEVAEKAGATAVVGISLDYEAVGKSMLMVSVTGTAVITEA